MRTSLSLQGRGHPSNPFIYSKLMMKNVFIAGARADDPNPDSWTFLKL